MTPSFLGSWREPMIGRGLAILLLLSGPADAESKPDRYRKAAARAKFISGNKAYSRGEFELALNDFEQGYALVLCLTIIGPRHRTDGAHHEGAHAALSSALAAMPFT